MPRVTNNGPTDYNHINGKRGKIATFKTVQVNDVVFQWGQQDYIVTSKQVSPNDDVLLGVMLENLVTGDIKFFKADEFDNKRFVFL